MSFSPAKIFGIALGIYFLSALVPGAMDNFFAADTTGWDTGTIALWGIIPLAIIGLLVMKFVPRGNKGE